MLEKYLTTSERHPHLHPDALITPSGVTFSSHGGPLGGVVMHNLRRVAAGLRGEYLEPEPEPEFEEQEKDTAAANGKRKGSRGMEDVNPVDTAQNDWQDMSEFEREEARLELGEIGGRTNVVQDGGDVPDMVAVNGVEPGEKRKEHEGDATLDKAARKKAKKLRIKEAKASKEKAREGKSQKER